MDQVQPKYRQIQNHIYQDLIHFSPLPLISELTIWAPTNEAFAASELKNLNDVDLLKNVLSYHLVSFKNDPKEISSIQYELSVPTLQGENVRISVYRKKGVSFAFGEVSVVVHKMAIINGNYQRQLIFEN